MQFKYYNIEISGSQILTSHQMLVIGYVIRHCITVPIYVVWCNGEKNSEFSEISL